tara:strand:+ start:43 stop:288 length:246 start_codon:yes stop_codon:yes gene_type:complete
MGGVFTKPIQMATQAGIIKPVTPTQAKASQTTSTSTSTSKAAKAKRDKIRAGRTGRSATILTTAKGLKDDETTTKKTLLGG